MTFWPEGFLAASTHAQCTKSYKVRPRVTTDLDQQTQARACHGYIQSVQSVQSVQNSLVKVINVPSHKLAEQSAGVD